MSLILKLAARRPLLVTRILFEKFFSRQFSSMEKLEKYFAGKAGIEIGGPSLFFSEKGFLPLYPLAKKIDGCNFSQNTVWEGQIEEGDTYFYATNKAGYQFICDGADVAVIPKGKYDFVLSCNNLEHIANPLKAIDNWSKLLKEQGTLVLVLPRKESNFDHRRSVTSFKHLLHDFESVTGEDDLSHLEEVLQLHDLELDPLAGGFENFKKRCENNFNNRCIHHHVFDLDLLKQACVFSGLTPMYTVARSCDYTVIAKKRKLKKIAM